MVCAILAGTKTQMRRIVKPPHGCEISVGWERTTGTESERQAFESIIGQPCPHGVPGDRLWVRETWAQPFKRTAKSTGVIYRADGPEHLSLAAHQWGEGAPWRPSIFMPRWASRLTLEVTEVRVQRLQEISEEDAKAEGVEPYRPAEGDGGAHEGAAWYRIQFSHLWDEINGKRAPWASNPWVWAISFKRCAVAE